VTFPAYLMDNSKDSISDRTQRLANRTASRDLRTASLTDDMDDKKEGTALLLQPSVERTSTQILGWLISGDMQNIVNCRRRKLWQSFLCF